jgi:hypothetical protein
LDSAEDQSSLGELMKKEKVLGSDWRWVTDKAYRSLIVWRGKKLQLWSSTPLAQQLRWTGDGIRLSW